MVLNSNSNEADMSKNLFFLIPAVLIIAGAGVLAGTIYDTVRSRAEVNSQQDESGMESLDFDGSKPIILPSDNSILLDNTNGVTDLTAAETKDTKKTGNTRSKCTVLPTPDMYKLRKTNSAIQGWVYIPGTAVNYAILHSPDDTYLYKDYKGNKDWHGSIYTREGIDRTPLILYGHNMKDGTMFAGLSRYSSSGYTSKHRYAYIYDGNGWKRYRFAGYHIYGKKTINNMLRDDRKGFLSRLGAKNDTADENMLFMSTCNRHVNRFVTLWIRD